MSRIREIKWKRYVRPAAAALTTSALTEAALIRLGQTYGSVPAEQAMPLLGDDIVPDPQVVTNHAIDIDAPPGCVWPWLVQMGWHRGGWYTARWVDQLLFPLNWPSANRIIPELQDIDVGDFIPDGAPETECGFIVEQLERSRAMALHSTSHLPASWRDKASSIGLGQFVLLPMHGGRRTRFLFRSRWVTSPWWLTLGGWLGIVPADLLMSHDMLHGVKSAPRLLPASVPRITNPNTLIRHAAPPQRPESRTGAESIHCWIGPNSPSSANWTGFASGRCSETVIEDLVALKPAS